MTSCESMDISKKIMNQHHFAGNFIQFNDGFDEIHNENKIKLRISYDTKGYRIGIPKPFLFKSCLQSTIPFSSKSRNSKLIVESFERGHGSSLGKRFLSLVDADGRLIKHLLQSEFPHATQKIQDMHYSLYTYCTEYDNVECIQVDEMGNEKFRNTTKNTGELIALSNLKEGGVVLFTASDKELHVVEMRPGIVNEKSYPVMRSMDDRIALTKFDEDNHQFTVRISLNDEICRRTFSWLTEN